MGGAVGCENDGDLAVPFFLGACDGAAAGRLDHAIGFDALRADTNALNAAVDEGAHPLQIGVPASVGLVVRVAHIVTESRSLATDITHAGHVLLSRLVVDLVLGRNRGRTSVPRPGRSYKSGVWALNHL